MPTAQDFDRVVEHVLGCTAHPKNHLKWQFYIGGKLIGYTMRSHSLRRSDQLSDRTLGEMAREMRCSTGLWKRLLNGQATRKDYLDDLVARGIIDQAQRETALREFDNK
jgi:hypothetical protein